MNALAQVAPAPSLTADSPLQAVQHIRRMRGGAQSHLMRASDGCYYVVKFQNNPQHIRVLANELLATRLAQRLGIPVPEPAVIEVSSWLIEHTEELRCQLAGEKIPFSSGLCFGSRFITEPEKVGTVLDYLPEASFDKVSNLCDFARILVLDKWACNSDGRQCVFTRPPRCRRYRVTFIDHGYCFNAGEWTFPDSPLRGVYACNAAYASVTGWRSFEPALSRAQSMSMDDIQQCAAGIPEAWYEQDNDALNRIVETLYSRRSLSRNLITKLRQSTRNPFPNWRD
jgi:hypothetical protein